MISLGGVTRTLTLSLALFTAFPFIIPLSAHSPLDIITLDKITFTALFLIAGRLKTKKAQDKTPHYKRFFTVRIENDFSHLLQLTWSLIDDGIIGDTSGNGLCGAVYANVVKPVYDFTKGSIDCTKEIAYPIALAYVLAYIWTAEGSLLKGWSKAFLTETEKIFSPFGITLNL